MTRISFENTILLHINTCPHTAELILSFLKVLQWEVLNHPLCCPISVPATIIVFGSLKKMLHSKIFSNDEEVKEVINEWLAQLGWSFQTAAIARLITRWKKCLTRLISSKCTRDVSKVRSHCFDLKKHAVTKHET